MATCSHLAAHQGDDLGVEGRVPEPHQRGGGEDGGEAAPGRGQGQLPIRDEHRGHVTRWRPLVGHLLGVAQGREVGQADQGEGVGGQVRGEAQHHHRGSAAPGHNYKHDPCPWLPVYSFSLCTVTLFAEDEEEAAGHGAAGHEDAGQPHHPLPAGAQRPGEADAGGQHAGPVRDLEAGVEEGEAQPQHRPRPQQPHAGHQGPGGTFVLVLPTHLPSPGGAADGGGGGLVPGRGSEGQDDRQPQHAQRREGRRCPQPHRRADQLRAAAY